MERTRRALMASVSSSRSSAGRATADKRTSSNYGVGLGNCHACGGIINWQGQGKPKFPVSIPCPGDVTHEHVARPVPRAVAAAKPLGLRPKSAIGRNEKAPEKRAMLLLASASTHRRAASLAI